jgi:hypothetical protein
MINNLITNADDYFLKYENYFDPYRIPTYVLLQYTNEINEIIETKNMVFNTMDMLSIMNDLKYISNINGFLGFVDIPPFTD